MNILKKLLNAFTRRRPLHRWPPGVPQPTVEEMRLSREKGLQMQMKHPAFVLLADEIAKMLEESEAVNYVEFQIGSEQYGPMSVLVQRLEGETPAQQNVRLRQRIAELEIKDGSL